jgi:hypothetical protein
MPGRKSNAANPISTYNCPQCQLTVTCQRDDGKRGCKTIQRDQATHYRKIVVASHRSNAFVCSSLFRRRQRHAQLTTDAWKRRPCAVEGGQTASQRRPCDRASGSQCRSCELCMSSVSYNGWDARQGQGRQTPSDKHRPNSPVPRGPGIGNGTNGERAVTRSHVRTTRKPSDSRDTMTTDDNQRQGTGRQQSTQRQQLQVQPMRNKEHAGQPCKQASNRQARSGVGVVVTRRRAGLSRSSMVGAARRSVGNKHA